MINRGGGGGGGGGGFRSKWEDGITLSGRKSKPPTHPPDSGMSVSGQAKINLDPPLLHAKYVIFSSIFVLQFRTRRKTERPFFVNFRPFFVHIASAPIWSHGKRTHPTPMSVSVMPSIPLTAEPPPPPRGLMISYLKLKLVIYDKLL